MKPNWFIAFEVRAPAWFQALAPAPSGSRVFHPADAHATLALLGPVDESCAMAAFRQAGSLVWAPGLFRPGPIHPFGPPRAPSAYSVEPADGAPWLANMIAEHGKSLIATATGKDPVSIQLPPARPHVTLARPGRKASASERAALAVWATRQRLPSEPVVIDRLALYTWAADRRTRLFEMRATALAPLLPVGPEPA